VVCRAGALTLAELCAVGVGSVLVPFPQAVDDHQTRNAEFLVERGARLAAEAGRRPAAAAGRPLRRVAAIARRLLAPGDGAGRARAGEAGDAAGRVAEACSSWPFLSGSRLMSRA
jgi:UDP-N-acetylglucosamine--N-acetylmuramyl-(pentapeptide) pyrophosphoryl-undecaprenol N-acetylglucosamine transferase